MMPAGAMIGVPPRSGGAQRAISIVPLLALVACGHGASVELNNGKFVEGKIIGSERERLYLENDHGGRVAVAPGSIQDIDHPGTVVAILGVAALATLCFPALNNETESVAALACLPSLAVLSWGGYLNVRSRLAATTAMRERERIRSLRPYIPAPTYRPAPAYQPVPAIPVPYEPVLAPEPAPAEPAAAGTTNVSD